MALRLRVREEAERKKLNISQLSRKSDLGVTTVRRMWFGTNDGTESGRPLENVNLNALEAIADALEVEPSDLIERIE